jgi:hypothetical protein
MTLGHFGDYGHGKNLQYVLRHPEDSVRRGLLPFSWKEKGETPTVEEFLRNITIENRNQFRKLFEAYVASNVPPESLKEERLEEERLEEERRKREKARAEYMRTRIHLEYESAKRAGRLAETDYGKAISYFGLSDNFTCDQLKQAYRRRSIKEHPDRGGSTERFQLLAHYNTLLEYLCR